ncbi:MAG: 50S ribosomal protein L25 [Candidatus Omnitrophota bacterium]|jgi:large subunit ribosomal protein L25
MEEIILQVEPRESSGKSKNRILRRGGLIPAVIYAKGKKTESLQVPAREFMRLLHEHHIESVVLMLRMKGEGEKKRKDTACLVKEIQYGAVQGDVTHIDFHEISLTTAIKVNVGIVAKGEAVGVKQDGGVLEHLLWEIEIECLPTKIPEQIEVDVSALKIGDTIHVKDIKIPEGIKVMNSPEDIVLSVVPPTKEEVAAAPVEGEEAKTEPEVIKEKKETPEEAQGDASKEPKSR